MLALSLPAHLLHSRSDQDFFPYDIFHRLKYIHPMTNSGSNDNPELLSVAQTAKLLDVTRQRVHDLIKNGQIVARKLGRYYYIEAPELERYQNQPTGKPYQPRSTSSPENSIDKCK